MLGSVEVAGAAAAASVTGTACIETGMYNTVISPMKKIMDYLYMYKEETHYEYSYIYAI